MPFISTLNFRVLISENNDNVTVVLFSQSKHKEDYQYPPLSVTDKKENIEAALEKAIKETYVKNDVAISTIEAFNSALAQKEKEKLESKEKKTTAAKSSIKEEKKAESSPSLFDTEEVKEETKPVEESETEEINFDDSF